MRDKLKYLLYRGIFTPLSWLPTPMLYGLGDGIRLLLDKGLGYRRKVIRENLRNSFPDISDEELRRIERDFYGQLADNVVETVKLLNMSDEEIDRRVTVDGGELVDKYASEGRPVVIYLGHYGNWEWVPAIVRHFSVPEINAQVYKPMHDKAFDRLMLKIRSRFRQTSVGQKEVFRKMLGWARDKKPFVIGFIADHRANSDVAHHHTEFLGQTTTFNPGGEEIGRRVNAAYLYLDIEKPERGHYHLTFKEIEPDPDSPDYPYTRRYLEMLEETIRRRPGLWLWSHRRWLYK
ncbi:MAG: lysophospholipid acyltransferase family protein [Duncaniella sp.]|nr:lysophospholipid acyltransferase family protein [Duncaniella sp.]